MQECVKWCAIGDSFTYLDSHLDETGYRVEKGYLTRTAEKLGFPVKLYNLGINGSSTSDWIDEPLLPADLYTILLGTNDWHSGRTPLGTAKAYQEAKTGSILGNLGKIVGNIRALSPKAPVIVMNPVERGDFIYLEDHTNNAHGSYAPENGLWLSEVADAIIDVVKGERIYTLDLHSLAGFTPENVVHFKRVRKDGKILKLPYPEYVGVLCDLENDPYPYPKDAVYMTYDGLHPSDMGSEKIAELLSDKIKEVM